MTIPIVIVQESIGGDFFYVYLFKDRCDPVFLVISNILYAIFHGQTSRSHSTANQSRACVMPVTCEQEKRGEEEVP